MKNFLILIVQLKNWKMKKIFMVSALVLVLTFGISCRDAPEEKAPVQQEQVEEEDEGILEKAGKKVDEEVNEEVDETIEDIGDDN